ncbi:hypothetical protein EV11_1067 [Prochlorococcus sp. SS52]|nr:hypothetical protein EV04_0047 [Prochlorococcus marinus str. LG]KGG22539.1 hypothetical protein EV08_0054 [Prochlorococcus marinus str. SS2]KGG24383.1 hypothetical protein EV09_0290 [Prochlorococcus marinus str. SS35]KGG34155.1 hypothetical protein EV10_0001 [Prochlorococcus marinus str. SS51]KGG35793.1 hypothetical protein EV11_1067 [Prochlorococcus sp. SS52]
MLTLNVFLRSFSDLILSPLKHPLAEQMVHQWPGPLGYFFVVQE